MSGNKLLSMKLQQPSTYWENTYDIDELISEELFRSGKEIHVWQSTLENCPDHLYTLSTDERNKAERFRNPANQHRYMASHSILRFILAKYSGCDAAALQFETNTYGKPFLANYNEKYKIHFNMTHSENRACYIISINKEVGIDIEYIKEKFDWSNIASSFFSSQEVLQVKSLPLVDQVQAFYSLWTRREALLKAYGTGLSSIDYLSEKEEFFSMFKEFLPVSFNFDEYYQGALAFKGEPPLIKFFEFRLTSWI